MHMYDDLGPDELYRKGLKHFNRREWQLAIATLSHLPSDDEHYPEAEELLARARLKLQLAADEPPIALAPPRPRIMLHALLVIMLCVAGASGFMLYGRFLPTPPVEAAVAKAVIPTATPQPTVVPTATAVPLPTEVPVMPASLMVLPADNETFVNTPKNIEIIIDASGSMLAEVPGTGKRRWQIAQEALKTLVTSGTITPQSSVAIRTYGHRKGGDCGDVEMVQGLSGFNADRAVGVIDGIYPAVGGMTPLGASLRAAAEDLQAAEGSTVVILVTDGLESCNGDPVAEAANFVHSAPQRMVHVIGFAIGDQDASNKLREIAVSGQGLYFDAANSAQLAESLRQTIVLNYQVVTADGAEVAAGTLGQPEPIELQPGTYKLKINANPPLEQELVVKSNARVEARLRQGYGGLLVDIHTGER